MTPPPHIIRRLLDHARTAVNSLEKVQQAYDQIDDGQHVPPHIGRLYARAASRINQAAQEMGR